MSNHRVDLGPEWAQMGEGAPPAAKLAKLRASFDEWSAKLLWAIFKLQIEMWLDTPGEKERIEKLKFIQELLNDLPEKKDEIDAFDHLDENQQWRTKDERR